MEIGAERRLQEASKTTTSMTGNKYRIGKSIVILILERTIHVKGNKVNTKWKEMPFRTLPASLPSGTYPIDLLSNQNMVIPSGAAANSERNQEFLFT
jgi:hypothetical protein